MIEPKDLENMKKNLRGVVKMGYEGLEVSIGDITDEKSRFSFHFSKVSSQMPGEDI